MEAIEAVNQLHIWCQQSNGAAIEIKPGVRRKFNTTAVFADADLCSIEDALSWPLPTIYQTLLRRVGQSQIFLDEYDLGLHLYSPADVILSSQNIWNEEEESGKKCFCFIGEHRCMGDYFGFVISRNDLANFDVFCHEYPPSEYMTVSNELKSWRTLDQWLVQVVASYGEETL